MSLRRGTTLLAPVLVCGALAILWSWPLAAHLATRLPGDGIGDNAVFLWNFWWMRTALATGASVFHTPYLFAPGGVDLTLHTHTLLPAFVGATLLRALPIAAALNITTLAALFLNSYCAYLLAARFTADRAASLAAALIFGGSPYIAAHLNGHFNLTMAWVLPLFALALTSNRQVLTFLLLGLTAYVDYYYVVYEAAFAIVWIAAARGRWSIEWRGPAATVARRAVGAAAILAAITALGIGVTGGGDVRVGGAIISMRGTFNALALMWVLGAVWAWLRFRPTIALARARDAPRTNWRAIGAGAAVLLVVASPIVWHAILLVSRGDYTAPRYQWRSVPAGVDLASFVLGNPFHGVWGGVVQRIYGRLGLNPIEGVGWLGVVPIALAALAIRRQWQDAATRAWTAIGAVFLTWSLGSHLHVFGWNTAMMLPATLLRFVPVVSNARMPGRAIVVVSLAMAVLAAKALAAWRHRSPRGGWIVLVAAALIAADFVPAPFPTVAIPHPAIDDVLRSRPERGAVCELPLGLADGFGDDGVFDRQALVDQTIHGRPICGGFVGRLPASTRAAYHDDPLLRGLLALSQPGASSLDASALPDRATAATLLARDGIAFLVIDRALASPALQDYVTRVLPVEQIADDGRRLVLRADFTGRPQALGLGPHGEPLSR